MPSRSLCTTITAVSLFALTLCSAACGWCEEPTKATLCQLKNDPPAYNHRLVEVSGFVSHAFEDFTLFDPACPSWPGVWLEYGGTSKSGTMYCCGVTADRHRPKELVIEDMPIPLLKNEPFEQFDKAIQPPFRSGQGAIVHATLVGRFFAGKQIQYFKGKPWGGYGHMGCCTLLAIQEIKAADTENRSDLDYGASPDQPDIGKKGCGFRELLSRDRMSAPMLWQQEADSGKHAWAFDDPEHVALDAFTRLAKIDGASLTAIRVIREAQGRKVYEWRAAGGKETYMVVVSRPYWLSFYSHDPKRVAWTPIAAYESSCGGKHAVTRLE